VLEFEDIQHILLTRTPAITGRYEFLSFDTPAGGRAWLSELLDKTQSAADAVATMDSSDRWVTLAFTWNGLRALGVPEESLQTFPDEFRTGMAARADILGDTGGNAPEHWVGGLAGDDLHAIAILFSRTDEQCRQSIAEHDKLLARTDGVRSLSYLVQLCPRPFRLPGPVVAAGDEGLGRGADTRFRRGAGTRRIHPGISRRERAGGESA
jgi:hypothetical protein